LDSLPLYDEPVKEKAPEWFAEVLIPLALPKNFTWSVPEEWVSKIQPGETPAPGKAICL
jgi:hypothetical protein